MSTERTQEPTPKRLADARRRGDVAHSRDLVSFAGLLGFHAVASFAFPHAVDRLRASVRAALIGVASLENVSPSRTLEGAAELVFAVSAPVLLAIMVAGATVAFVDAGPVFALSRVAPDLGRLDPAKGFAQLFSRERFVELGKSSVVLVALVALAASTLLDAIPSLARLATHRPSAALPVLGTLLEHLLLRALMVGAALAVADFILSRRAHLRRLRMTPDEVRREHKESDGDPHMKSERARQHRQILEHSVLESVRRADVLIVNPTHIAVALRFDEESEQNAPEVIAMGEDHLARKMIEVAREAGVPVMRDVPLARRLHELELGDEIPEALYEAVAAVLRAAWAEREAEG